MKEKEKHIKDYLDTYGLLLCNENKYLPSLFEVGGDWDSIVAMIEKREVFYCKIFRKRTCYISRELYFLLKEYKQSMLGLPDSSRRIYDFLCESGPADTETIRNLLMLGRDSFSKAFDILLERMLATAVRRGKTLGASWSTFIWGAYADWEKDAVSVQAEKMDPDRIFKLLEPNLTEKDILKIIGKKL